jgi:mono/diheme cytochrome c family protein
MLSNLFSPRLWTCCAVLTCFSIGGCDDPDYRFEPNTIFAKRLELTQGVPTSQAGQDVLLALEELFGTPDAPRWPEFLSENGRVPLVLLERLEQAAGPVSSDENGQHRGLYREHCIVCHGTSGDGLGASAALLNPYPRDFRLGKVKFKRTPSGVKPTRQDLADTLRRGLVGTSMPAFDLLAEEEVQALVDYVIYLSVRGEVERRMLSFAATELDLEEGERVYDPNLREQDPEGFEEQWEVIVETTERVARDWRDAEEAVPETPQPPDGLLLLGRDAAEESDELSQADAAQIAASVAHGQELFRGNIASCAFCHGPDALGDGQQNNYDDWTRDWTAQAGLNPADEESLEPMLELGALKPRPILPRNLRRGLFRGGGDPETLYRRIVYGIEGTPMPAAPMKPDNPQGLTEQDVWDIVNYLLSLSPADVAAGTAATEIAATDASATDSTGKVAESVANEGGATRG